MTNLVDRVSAEEAELSKDEMSQSVPALLDKIVQYKPRVLCFVGKGIWVKVDAAFKKRIRQHVKTFDSISRSPIKSGRKAKEEDVSTTIDLSPPMTNGTIKELQPFSYGPQPYKFIFEKESSKQEQETLIFVMPSTVAL
ncbi:hypothetical protein Clacol_003371 [Clathrus columnatus]|uniref:Uncharacterized protein n=1 Tax=Clathrus columnatus TaxID=1419009 RepID=A0AAV5A3A6_9AGAM|nr:hypothetical protein Clacol_003371 [Clathrus columnatus]